MNKLNIVCLNANGLHASERRQRTLTWCRQQKADIVLLQEVHSVKEDEGDWRNDWEGTVFMSHGVSNSRGVTILVSPKINYDLRSEIVDPEGRYIILEICINDRNIVICNSYGFNEDKPEFFQTVIDKIESLNYESLIWGGDHNVVLNVKLDKDGGLPKTHEPE